VLSYDLVSLSRAMMDDARSASYDEVFPLGRRPSSAKSRAEVSFGAAIRKRADAARRASSALSGVANFETSKSRRLREDRGVVSPAKAGLT
jgi:hypothetical protein